MVSAGGSVGCVLANPTQAKSIPATQRGFLNHDTKTQRVVDRSVNISAVDRITQTKELESASRVVDNGLGLATQ